MFVKRGEDGKIVSLFIGCVPDELAGYVEEPDDMDAAKAFFDEQKALQTPAQTEEERIAALEEELKAAKILLGVE